MAWIKGEPREKIPAPDLNNVIRDNNAALEAALNAWIEFATGGVQTGHPRQGSARVYFQNSAPIARLDGNYFTATDLGCIWIDSNSTPVNQFNILTAADGAGTETWTPISTEIIAVLLAANRIFAGTLKSTGDFTVGANKVVVTAANGNTAIAGTLGVTGIATLAKGSLLASSDPPTTNPMIANKKYVDDIVAAEAFSPDPMTGDNDSTGTVTFPNGLIWKWGKTTRTGEETTVTFGTPFPNACFQAISCGGVSPAHISYNAMSHTITVASFKIHNADANCTTFRWFAVGR